MTNLRAALTLTLEDKLSAGLDRLKDGLTKLKDVGKQLSLGKLGDAAQTLQAIISSANTLASALRSVEAVASRAGAAVKRVWEKRFGEQSRAGGFAAAAEGYSVIAPVEKYARYEDELRRIGIMKGLTGAALNAEIRRLRPFLDREALETGQTGHIGAETYIDLVKAGTSLKDTEVILPMHHRAATAFYTDPRDFTKVTAAANNQFKIPHDQMDQALSAVGLMANLGQMTVAQFGQEVPRIAGLMTAKGMTGRENFTKMIAMMQTQMLTSGQAGSAAAEVGDGIDYLYSPAAMNSFMMRGHNTETHGDISGLMKRALGGKASGINLYRFLKNVEAKDLNPLEAMLDKLENMKAVGKLSDTEMGVLMAGLFHNAQARNFWQTQLNLRGHRREIESQGNAVDPAKSKSMFDARNEGPEMVMKKTMETLNQLVRRIGEGFQPIVGAAGRALEFLFHQFERLDAVAPGATNAILLAVGATLAFGAALAALGVVGPPIAKGFALWFGGLKAITGLLFTTTTAFIALAATAIAAALDIYNNWDRFAGFFGDMWDGIQRAFGGFIEFIAGVFNFDMDGAAHGLMRVWAGLETFFSGLWGVIKTLFVDFAGWVDGWADGAGTAAIDHIKATWNSLGDWFADLWARIIKPFSDFTTRLGGSSYLQHLITGGDGTPAPAGATSPYITGGGPDPARVHISADPGLTAKVISAPPGVAVTTSPDPGRTLGKH